MKVRKVRVGVTGFGGLANPHSGTAVAEALRKGSPGEIEIHALVYDSMMTGAWMPGVADFLHLVPPLHYGPHATLDRLIDIHEQYGLDAIIPCLTLELPFYSGLADQLARGGIKTMLPPVPSIRAASKVRLPHLAHSNGWPTPKTIHVGEIADVPLHAEQFGFPLMVKGRIMGAIRVNSVEHVQEAARELDQVFGGGVLLQEILTGDQICVGGVIDRNGEPTALASMQKLGLNSDGQAVLGAVIDDPLIEEQARRIIGKLNWCGPLELDFIRSYRSDIPYLVQVNGRFPSWVLLTHMAGCNLPATLLHNLLERRLAKPAKPRPGTMFVRHVRETFVSLDDLDGLERHGLARPPPHIPRAGTRAKVREASGIRVAVTGLGNFDVVNPGLGAASALKRVDEVSRIYGFGYGTYESGMYDRQIFDTVYRLPIQEDAQALLERIREIHFASPIDVILPCLDGEIVRFIEKKMRSRRSESVRCSRPGMLLIGEQKRTFSRVRLSVTGEHLRFPSPSSSDRRENWSRRSKDSDCPSFLRVSCPRRSPRTARQRFIRGGFGCGRRETTKLLYSRGLKEIISQSPPFAIGISMPFNR